jgi:hypothetical protein
MVTVAPLPPPGAGVGEGVLELPPHAEMRRAPNAATTPPLIHLIVRTASPSNFPVPLPLVRLAPYQSFFAPNESTAE